MNIILDDDLENRQTPTGFTRFTTGFDLMEFMKQNPDTNIEYITFDNDLGSGLPEGYDVVKEMILDNWRVKYINLHSANTVAVKNMISYIQSAVKSDVFKYERLTKRPLYLYSQKFDKKE